MGKTHLCKSTPLVKGAFNKKLIEQCRNEHCTYTQNAFTQKNKEATVRKPKSKISSLHTQDNLFINHTHEASYSQSASESIPKGIPSELAEKWQASDANRGVEHIQDLQRTKKFFEEAAQLCAELTQRNKPMSLTYLEQIKTTLATAAHKADDMLWDFNSRYPVPRSHTLQAIAQTPAIASKIPKLLCSTEEKVIIWVPRLPNKRASPHNLLTTELRDFLHDAQLPHFERWHCLFLHIHSAGSGVGVKDVDNYEYKRTIDMLAFALRTKDSADYFSMTMRNYFSDTIPEGCYIYITKQPLENAIVTELENLSVQPR